MAIKFLNTVAVDTSVLYVNAANNRVGINTVSPGNTLSVGDGTVDESLAVYHSDGTSTRIHGYGLYMSRSASYIRPTSGNSQTLYIGNVTKPWSGAAYNANTHYFQSGANENMRITSTGYVGIGTTSPAVKLHTLGAIVGGTTGFGSGMVGFTGLGSYNSSTAVENIDALYLRKAGTDGSSTSIALASAGGDSYYVGSRIKFIRTGSNSKGHLAFETKGDTSTNTTVERMRIEDGGNVGIGTDSPAVKLHVTGEVRAYDSSNTYYANLNANSSWGYFNTNATKIYINKEVRVDTGLIGSYNEDLQLRTEGSTKMYIKKDNGNVGIGTTNPSAVLHVSSDNPILKLTDSNSTHRYAGLSLATNGGEWSLSNGDSTTATNSNLYITRSTTGSDNRFIFHRDSYYFGVYDNTNTIKTIIKANGDSYFNGGGLGIGTTSLNAKLHVVNGSSGQTYSNVSGALIDVNGTSNSYSALRVGSSTGNNHLVVTNAGKVGIGTTSPNEKLSVDTGSNGSAGYISVDSQTLTRLKLGYSFTSSPSAITAAQIYADSSGNLDISSRGNAASAIQLYTSSGTSPSERMRIASDGKVGIGTTSPAHALDVDGRIQAGSDGLQIDTGGYGYIRIRPFYGAMNTSTSLYVGGVNGYSYQPVYASAFNVNSDYRLKTNVVDLEEAIERIKQINVHRFNWKDSLDEEKVDGFLAHELAEVIPEAVTGKKDAVREDGTLDYQGVDQAKVVPLLTAALQEAILKIEQLETRIQTLENN